MMNINFTLLWRRFYVVLLLIISSWVNAQLKLPGGLTNLNVEYWLKADEVSVNLPDEGESVRSWRDLSGNNRNFSSVNSYQPRFKENAMNFHSAVEFQNSGANSNQRKLVSDNVFTAESTKSYFVVWVSRLAESSSYSIVITLSATSNTGAAGNSFGWYNSTLFSRGNIAINTSFATTSGMALAMMPNVNVAGNEQSQYLNGEKGSTARNSLMYGNTSKSSIGGTSVTSNGAYYNFFGEVMEILVLSKDGAGQNLTTDEIQKLNSHYAIKYGLTLKGSNPNYVFSDGTIIYNSSGESTYNKNIFGIARDDASNLLQKQSASENKQGIVLYQGELGKTNLANFSTSLADKNAVVLGSNNGEGMSIVAYNSSTIFQSGQLNGLEKISRIHNYRLKAKLTGNQTQTVSLKSEIGHWVMVSSTENFTPASTRIYKMTNGKAENITLNNGEYIGFGYDVKTPGGVSGLDVEYWLRADDYDDEVDPNNSPVSTWKDRSIYGRDFMNDETAPFLPRFKRSAMNFHSAVEFYDDGVSGDNNQKRKLISKEAFLPSLLRSYFVVTISKVGSNSSTNASIFTLNASTDRGNALANSYGWTSAGKLFHETSSGTANIFNAAEKKYGIGIHMMPNSGSQWMYTNGLGESIAAKNMSTSSRKSSIGVKSIYVTNVENYFYGDVLEVIVFSKEGAGQTLSSDELTVLNSHYALKYGIPLNAIHTSFKLSDGVTEVFNTTTESTFNKNVMGLVRDDAGLLHQNQASSVERDDIVVYFGELAETNAENNSTILNDMHALLFSSNGQDGNRAYLYDSSTSFAPGGTLSNLPSDKKLSEIYNYQLKAKTTGSLSTYTINFKSKLGQYLLVSTTPDFIPSSTRLYPIVDGVVNNVVINNGDYVGWAYYAITPGGIDGTRVELWLKADELANDTDGGEVSEWKDNRSGHVFNNKFTSNRLLPRYKKNGMNFNPAVEFLRAGDRLISELNTTIDLTRSYYMIWISRQKGTSYSTVLNMNSDDIAGDGDPGNSYGWNGNIIWSQASPGGGDLTFLPANIERTYGVAISSVSNASSTYQFLNGLQSTRLSGTVYTTNLYTNITPMVLGTTSLISNSAAYNFVGDVMEIIVLSKAGTGNHLDGDDLLKVNSQLALKYGITLNESQQKYLLSNNASIYDYSTGTGYERFNKFIIGIGRDDASGFNQKQSISTDAPDHSKFIVYAGDLAETNKENTKVLTDKSALVLGTTNEIGYQSYNITQGTTFANGVIIPNRITSLYKNKLRAKITGTSDFTVGLKVPMGEWLVVSSDESFTPNTTDIYPVINGKVENVSLKDGDYLALASYIPAPGGIGSVDIELWLDADQPMSTPLLDGQEVSIWKDKIGYNFTNTFTDAQRFLPRYKKSAMNYHSAVEFYYDDNLSTPDNNNKRRLISEENYQTDLTSSYHVIWVSRLNVDKSNGGNVSIFNLLANSATTGEGGSSYFGWYNPANVTNKSLMYYNSTVNTGSSLSTERKYGIGMSFLPNQNSTTNLEKIYLNGLSGNEIRSYTMSTNRQMVLGTSSLLETRNDNFFNGDVMEVIVMKKAGLNQPLTVSEIQKVYSHLAIKYGITLNEAQTSYMFAEGDVVYDMLDPNYSNYKTHIFGIARDDHSGLYQKQSTSTDSYNEFAISIDNFAETNKENTGTLADQTALILGGNGLEGHTIYFNSSTYITGRTTNLFNYKYKAKLTGVSSMDIKIKTGMGHYVLVSSDPAFPQSNTRVYEVVEGEVPEKIQINDGDYIGFAKFFETPGGISNVNIDLWLKADEIGGVLPEDGADVTSWRDMSGRNFGNDLGQNSQYFPRFVRSAMNYHSSVDFYFLESEDGGTSVDNNRKRKLISENTFAPLSNRSYYAIWVSRIDKENSGTNAAVLNINATNAAGSTGANSFGFTKSNSDTPAKLWTEINNSNFNSSSSAIKDYGIAMSVLPNLSGASSQFILNGQKDNITTNSVLNTTPSKSVLGTVSIDGTSPDYFFGEVMEVILLSRDANGTFSQDEIDKINTNLSIKYGVSLNESQVKYVLSNGIEVYDRGNSNYSGYSKDIFGIARDDASGLYQKQSISVDSGIMAVSLGELANTNAENSSTLVDKEALIFGANGLSGEALYDQPLGTEFKNHIFDRVVEENGEITEEKMNSRFNYVLKVKITGGTTKTVKLYPNQGEWLLVSQDSSFLPINTDIYKNKGEAIEVELKDGDYIGFGFFLKAPGNVTNGLRMWLNASRENTLDLDSNNEIESWMDSSGLGTIFRNKTDRGYTKPLLLKRDERTNFHPTAYFRQLNQFLSTDKAPYSIAQPEKTSIYAVVNANFAAGSDRTYFIGFGSKNRSAFGRRPAFGVMNRSNQGRGRVATYSYYSNSYVSTDELFKPGATTIAGFYRQKGITTAHFQFDGHESQVTMPWQDGVMNAEAMLGNGSQINGYYLNGMMPEMILYESELTFNEKQRVNSYLGLKYGITLDLDLSSITSNYDYVISDGSFVWAGNSIPNQLYHNNVASVIRDENSNLYNFQAKSTNVGSIVHMGVGTKLGIEPELGVIIEDKSALTWGHNGAIVSEVSFIGNEDICGELDRKIGGRIWLAQNKNFNQPIYLTAYGPDFTYNGANYQVYLLVADSAEKLEANNWDQIIPMFYQDDKHGVQYQFKGEYNYFTFGAKVIGTCESCEFDGVKRFEFDKNMWPKYWGERGPKTNNLGDGFNLTVEVEDPDGAIYSRNYPRRYSKNSLLFARKGTSAVTTKIKFTDDSGEALSAATSFEVYDIDRQGRRYDNVQVVGYCNGSPVYPKLSYMFNRPERSVYKTFSTGEGKAKVIGERYNGRAAGYFNKRGKMFVEFEMPVEEIHIISTLDTNNPRYSNYLGIGPMEMYCPAPLPLPNEEGLILTKQASVEAKLCEVVDYTFRAINTNCAVKEVTFKDELPAGMVWVNNSFTALDQDIEELTITGYGTRTLTVEGLKIYGGALTNTYRASALFDENAMVGDYNNQAEINYSLTEGEIVSQKNLTSKDHFTGEDKSKTKALDAGTVRPKPLETTMTFNKGCFRPDNEIEVTVKIKNDNAFSIDNVMFDFDYNGDGFKFDKDSKLTSSNTFDVNLFLEAEDSSIEESLEGYLFAEGITIPPGEHWFKFTLRANSNLEDFEISDETLNPVKQFFSYTLNRLPSDDENADDDCMDAVTSNSNGEIDLEFCTYCTKQSVGGTPLPSNMGISVMKENFNGWPANVPNGYLVLEAGKRGMVVTRTTPEAIGVENWVTGMIIFDTSVGKKCISIYNGTDWKCIERSCNDN